MSKNLKNFTKNVKGYIQILPQIDLCWDDVKLAEDNKTIYIRSVKNLEKEKKLGFPHYWAFVTDGIIFNKTPSEIFDEYIKESLEKSIQGINILIFGFGQTGTGKSSTINGLHTNYENRGITPRVLSEIFNIRQRNKIDLKIKLKVSYVEVEKVNVIDLLQNNGNKNIQRPYKTLELKDIHSDEEGLKYLFQGESQRELLKNNHNSNKLTSIFTIHVHTISRLISQPVEKYSKIHIIDMAGIDVIGNDSCYWKKAREIGLGNSNKSQIELCLLAIQNDIINNRNTIKDAGYFVDYLGKSLGAHSIIKFIGHISTSRKHIPITLSTLRFINLAKSIKSAKLKPFIEQSPPLLIKKLQKQLTDLKKQMYLNSMVMNEDLSFNLTQARHQQMGNAIEDFIKDKSDRLAMLNITDAMITSNIFKEICTKLAAEILELSKKVQQEAASSSRVSNKTSSSSERATDEKGARGSKTSRNNSLTNRKKRLSDRSSRYSKQSGSNKLNVISSLTKSGITFGQLMSHNFEGDVTKSLKLKSKLISKTSIEKINEEVPVNETDQGKSINLMSMQTELVDDFETTWNLYKDDDKYKFAEISNNMVNLEELTRGLLKYFNETTENLHAKLHKVDVKKSDMLKIEIFRGTKLECGSNETIKLNEVRENLGLEIIEIIKECADIREVLLRTQSEINININEYHRLKSSMLNDFSQYCTDNLKVKVPSFEQIEECIEDKINYTESKSYTAEELEELEKKKMFYRYQKEMERIQKKRLEEKLNIVK